MTSHAAVIGRGIGLPCVVGASDIKFQPSKKRLTTPDGRTFAEGDIITIDGTNGQVLAGQPKMVEAALAKKASYLLIFFDIVTGISKTPGTLIILTV